MRIAFEFTFNNKLILPLNYNYILQGFIYNNIADKKIQEFIHNKGFTYEKRHYKLFTFSRLMGKYKIENIIIVNFFGRNFIISTESRICIYN